MLGRNHALSGAVGYLAAAPLIPGDPGLATIAAGTVVCAGWALAPDIDHPGSTVSRKFGPAGRAASAGANVALGGHRQGSHSLLASAIVTFGAWYLISQMGSLLAAAILASVGILVAAPLIGKAYGLHVTGPFGALLAISVGILIWTERLTVGDWLIIAIALGFVLHWMGDALTPQGVPVLWPFSRWRLKVPLFTTGSPVESVVSVGFILALTILAWARFSPALPWLP